VRYARLPSCLLVANLVAAAINGCLDVTPLDVARPPRPDGGLSDSRTQGPCEACLFAPPGETGPNCEEPLAECAANPRCAELRDCLRFAGCYEATDGDEAGRCGTPCALELGITSLDDPAILPIFAISDCSLVRCPGLCFPKPDSRN
jgi:hypothetical protein